jgi:uncharacterized protein
MTELQNRVKDDPMSDTLLHYLLVTTNRWQSIPAPVVVLVILLITGVVYGVWHALHGSEAALSAAFACGLLSFTDWFLLWMLPRAGQSYGLDRPSALALAVVRGLALAMIGLMMLPVGVAVGLSVLVSLVAFYATWLEPFRLGVTRQYYATDKWQQGHAPLRLLHVADLHIERITPRERRLNALIRELQPDVIVFSGDFVNISFSDDAEAETAIRRVIGAWSAPLGVYCVPGTYTVEPADRVQAFVAGLDNLRLLKDECVALETPAGRLNILGMVTTHILEQDRQTVQELANYAPPDDLNLLLTHAPDVAPEADAAGYDLYLCGHTHGGQLRFPLIGAIFTGSHLGRRFAMGRYDLQNVTVYTSRGVGMEGLGAPRARFLCPPEITLWEIVGSG